MSVRQTEQYWERRLGIHTSGEDESRADKHHSPYQPTDYRVLERIARTGIISGTNTLVDYGSGMGRVAIALSEMTGCHAIGVEYDARLCARAESNAKTHPKTRFVCEDAARFEVPVDADRFFFFNPFSTRVFLSVLRRVRDSLNARPREIMLLFYFPVEDYIDHLSSEFPEWDEIDCRDLFGTDDPRERVLICRMSSAE